MEFLAEFAKTHGVVGAIAVFLIYWQAKNYRGVCERLNKVEDYCKTTMAGLVEESIKVIARNNDIATKCQQRADEK